MTPAPPSPLSAKEVERLQLENAQLRAANESLRNDLARLVEAQRSLMHAHAQLEKAHRMLMGGKPAK